MTVFFTDLDNTLIYSYHHPLGQEKICVEIYQGREVSFVTEKTWELLKQVRQKTLFIPVTTRTQEQYGRIDLKIETPVYALVCNGGVLLKEGKEVEEWYQESLALIGDSRDVMENAQLLMEQDENRSFEVRNIRDLFLFTKSSAPRESAEYLRERLDTKLVGIYQNGVKVYVVPRRLNKGQAARRLLESLRRAGESAELVLAAGDSEFDIPMLESAGFGFAPESLKRTHRLSENVAVGKEEQVFSEFVLEQVIGSLNID